MKTNHLSSLIFTLAIWASTSAGVAQNYSVSWFKIAGGGGASMNGHYLLKDTIGQYDAGGPMTNGQYSVTGGFWAVPIAVQVGGAPRLKIVPAGPGQVTISWSPNSACYGLQETLSLSPTNWIVSPSGSTNPVTVPATLPAKYYRLFWFCVGP